MTRTPEPPSVRLPHPPLHAAAPSLERSRARPVPGSASQPRDHAPAHRDLTRFPLVLPELQPAQPRPSLHRLPHIGNPANGFLRFLVDTRRLDENPLMRLRRQYSAPRWEDFLAGLLGLHNASLVPAIPRPRFVSSLAPQLAAFVDLKRAMGRRYQTSEAELQRFDRFLASCGGQSTALTQQMVDAWTQRCGHLKPPTRRHRIGLVRQFCLYVARQDPTAYVPEPARSNGKPAQFTPHIYTVAEFRRLLEAARSLPARRGSLHPSAVHTVLLILYGTGLRSGEALRLRLRDVDLVTGVVSQGKSLEAQAFCSD